MTATTPAKPEAALFTAPDVFSVVTVPVVCETHSRRMQTRSALQSVSFPQPGTWQIQLHVVRWGAKSRSGAESIMMCQSVMFIQFVVNAMQLLQELRFEA